MDALPGSCSLLDVGCANGHLMESIVSWAAEQGITVEPYGVEISAAQADLASRRLPQCAARIRTANILGWSAPRRFDVIRTDLEYVPPNRRADLVAQLVAEVAAPDGRLIVGTNNEQPDLDTLAAEVRSWGCLIRGHPTRPHQNPALAYKEFWLDVPAGGTACEGSAQGLASDW